MPSDSVEVVVDDLIQSPAATDPDKKTEPSPADDLEIIVEGQEPAAVSTDGGEPDELTKLQTQLTELQSKLQEAEKRELTQAQELHAARKAAAAPAEPVRPSATTEEKLTPAQLLAIVREHKDDPEVLLNVINHVAEQKALAIRDKTMEDVDQRTWHQNLSSIENRAISEDPILAKRPDIVDKLPSMAAALRLDKHPFGRYLAYLAYRAGNDVSESPETTAAAEATRVADLEKKKDIDKTKTPSKKSVTLSTEQAEMAKRFSVSPSLYAKFVRPKEA